MRSRWITASAFGAARVSRLPAATLVATGTTTARPETRRAIGRGNARRFSAVADDDLIAIIQLPRHNLGRAAVRDSQHDLARFGFVLRVQHINKPRPLHVA